MSDDNEVPEQAEADSAATLFDQPDGVDWFLANQVHMAEAFKIEQGVSLTIGGVLVSGTIISGRTYFEELGEHVRAATKGTDSEMFGGMMGDTHKVFAAVYPEPEEGEQRPYRPISYIHLRDAHVIGSNGYISGQTGVLWRGKLAAVDGYFFGSARMERE